MLAAQPLPPRLATNSIPSPQACGGGNAPGNEKSHARRTQDAGTFRIEVAFHVHRWTAAIHKMQGHGAVRVHRQGGIVNRQSVGSRSNGEGHEQIEALPGHGRSEAVGRFRSQ